MENTQQKQSVIRSAIAMALGTLSSRVLGLIRDQVLAALFSRTVTDAFIVAFRLPNMFRRLLGEGSLSVSFIPIFIDHLTLRPQESPDQAKQRAMELANSLFALLGIVASLLSVLGVILMPQLIGLVAGGEGFMAVEGKYELTVFLGRIMFSYLFLVTTYAYLMAIANALKKFFVAAMAPAFFNLIFIIFAFLPQEWGRMPGEFLAWSLIAGGVIQVGMVSVQLLRLGFHPRILFHFSHPGLKRVLRNMLPGIVGLGVFQIMGFINIRFASRLGEGSHSYIYWADRILELPQSLVAISLGTALLPVLSELWSRGDRLKMVQTAEHHMKLLLFMAWPSAVGMFVLAGPIVEVLFMRGQFDASDVAMTTVVVQIYSVLLLFSSLTKVIVPAFYAIQNTWLPALVSLIALLFHVVAAHFGVNYFGLAGLVSATALAALVNMSLCLAFFKVMIGPLKVYHLLTYSLKLIVPLAVMAALAEFSFSPLRDLFSFLPSELPRIMALGVTISLSILIYFVAGKIMGIRQANQILELVARRVKKKKI